MYISYVYNLFEKFFYTSTSLTFQQKLKYKNEIL